MRKGFTRKPDPGPAPATTLKNYITPGGLQRLVDERRFLLTRERPAVTQVVAWAASNGDRSENADDQCGKRRLRDIDRRIRFLTKRIDAAEVVDPEQPRTGRAATHVFFGATVRYGTSRGTKRVVSIVGLDEVELEGSLISWVSPLARSLMKAAVGDQVTLAPLASLIVWRSWTCGISASPSSHSPSRQAATPHRCAPRAIARGGPEEPRV